MLFRITLRHPTTSKETIFFLTPGQEKDDNLFKDPETGVELELLEKIQLTEWLVNNYKTYGASLEFITNRSQEGSQFEKGFGGLGGRR